MTLINICLKSKYLAAGVGVEPTLTDPESVVLPLDEPAIKRMV